MQQPAGFAEFASREYPRLVGALSLHCRDRHVAEEIVQEALVRAASGTAVAARVAASIPEDFLYHPSVLGGSR